MKYETQYDKIERANYGNILNKLKEGKTLTASDRRMVENYQRKQEGLRPKQSDAELAQEFDVDRRTITRWKKQKAPLDDTNKDMYQWLVANNSSGAKDWIRAYRDAHPDQFPKKKAAKKAAKKTDKEKKTPEQLCDDYFAELQHAREVGDEVREKIAVDHYLKINKQLRDQEAHNKRLGLDSGEVLPKSEVERIIRNAAWAGNACCDKFSKQLAQRLSNKSPAEVHKILKPTLTGLLVFEGMKRLAKVPGDINLPQWVIDCFLTERKKYLKP